MNSKMRSSVMGLILGQFSSPLPMAQKEPVAYLYNGVRLPKLPEWDRAVYPYAVMIYRCVPQLYELRCLSADAYYGENFFKASNGILSQCKDGVWGAFGTLEGESYAYVPLTSSIDTLVWANFTMENNGTTYLIASEPIPVYE